MAELGLAIAGVASAGGALAKSLYALYHSARDAYKEAKDVARHLALLKSVLQELKRTVRKRGDQFSPTVRQDIRGILLHCQEIFDRIEILTSPLLPGERAERPVARLGGRIKWHFKKVEVRLLNAQLDSITMTINLLVTMVMVGHHLSSIQHGDGQSSTKLTASLGEAGQLITNERSALQVLSLTEEQFFNDDDVVASEQRGKHSEVDRGQWVRISAWLHGIVGFSEHSNGSSRSQSAASVRSTVTLSLAQRSVAGAASSDVEMLLEKWTNLSTTRSRASQMDVQSQRSYLSKTKCPPPKLAIDSSPSETSSSEDESGSDDLVPIPSDLTVGTHHNEKRPDGDKRTGTGPPESTDDTSIMHSWEKLMPFSVYPLVEANDSTDQSKMQLSVSSMVSSTPVEEIGNANASSVCQPLSFKFATVRTGTESEYTISTGKITSSEDTSSYERLAKQHSSGSKISLIGSVTRFPRRTILKHLGAEDDTETVRDLRRIERGQSKGVRIANEAVGEPGQLHNLSRVENWILGNDVNSESRSDFGSGAQFPRSPFSDMSILNPTSASQAPSMVSSISTIRNLTDPRRVDKLLKLANGLAHIKKYSTAAALYREAYKVKLQQSTQEDSQMLEIKFRIAVVLGAEKKWSSAERVLQSVRTKQMSVEGELSTATQVTTHFLARIFCKQQKWQKAKPLYSLLWEERKESLSSATAKAPATALALRTGQELGRVLVEMAQYEEAVDILQQIYPRSKELRGAEDVKITLDTGVTLGLAFRNLGKSTESKILLDEIYATLSYLGSGIVPSRIFNVCKFELANLALQCGDNNIASTLAREVYESRRDEHGDRDPTVIDSGECLAKALTAQENFSEALQILWELHSSLVESLGPANARTLKNAAILSEVLVSLNKSEEARKLLQTSYHASQAIEDIDEERLDITEKLAPLLLSSAQRCDARMEKIALKSQAIEVYKNLYKAQQEKLGSDSLIALSTGHEYGSLCVDFMDFTSAETALTAVWAGRKKILGETNALSVASGFQLGQVLFWTKKEPEALTTMSSVHDLHMTLYGFQNLQTIESAEILGLLRISGVQDREHIHQAFSLLRGALEARKELLGLVSGTYAAAIVVALIAATKKKMKVAEEIMTWVFDTTKAERGIYQIGKLIAGFSCVVFPYVRGRTSVGNAMLQRVVDYVIADSGLHSDVAQVFSYGQALLLLLQRESQEAHRILRESFRAQKKNRGANHIQTIASGEIFATSLIVDSLISSKPISLEADRTNDWLFQQRGGSTYTMRFCMIAAVLLSSAGLDTLEKGLLDWLYRTQKRLFGRFSRECLTTLATTRALGIKRMYNRAKKIPSQDGTIRDPRIFLPILWPAFTSVLSHLHNKACGSTFFMHEFPIMLAKVSMFRISTRDTLLAEIVKLFMLVTKHKALSEFYSQAPAETASRVRTVYSQSSVGSDSGSDARQSRNRGSCHESFDYLPVQTDQSRIPFDEQPGSIDLFDLLGGAVDLDNLSSLGASILDLAAPSESENQRADITVASLQSSMVRELVNDEDIDIARSNMDELEQEAEFR
ncbi:hypothetical protein EJ08DRAFT_693322 [Tothia fuscella]|uniref:Fungal N-terminal domain-containing protein n=1 Tax=Tothia fuscella TaxID=1048955 RepID=A0A9P4NYL8_9PEZI|nr:hypothetical protein EJ08DRAFT_693322 [Tothia fuscella]